MADVEVYLEVAGNESERREIVSWAPGCKIGLCGVKGIGGIIFVPGFFL